MMQRLPNSRAGISKDDYDYFEWLNNKEMFFILDKALPLRARCYRVTAAIASQCDWAHSYDFVGFSKCHADAGHRYGKSPHGLLIATQERFYEWCITMYHYRNQIEKIFNTSYLKLLFEISVWQPYSDRLLIFSPEVMAEYVARYPEIPDRLLYCAGVLIARNGRVEASKRINPIIFDDIVEIKQHVERTGNFDTYRMAKLTQILWRGTRLLLSEGITYHQYLFTGQSGVPVKGVV